VLHVPAISDLAPAPVLADGDGTDPVSVEDTAQPPPLGA
jgi:hypothetical protein